MIAKGRHCLELLNRAAGNLESPFLLLVRLYWGWQFTETGWGKVNHLERVANYFASLGIPFPGFNAAFVAGVEAVGGLLLALGLAARPTGLLLTGNMLVAYLAADREAFLSFWSDPDKFVAATPFPFLWASLLSLVFGAGRWSVDHWLAVRGRAK